MSYRLGIDIGGTFTDVVGMEIETGKILVTKVPSIPVDPSRAVAAVTPRKPDPAGRRPWTSVGQDPASVLRFLITSRSEDRFCTILRACAYKKKAEEITARKV